MVMKTPLLPLDPMQRLASETPEGPVMVLGGAGTGKTQALLGRITALLHHGERPDTISYLTPHSMAAADMSRRLRQLPEVAEKYRSSLGDAGREQLLRIAGRARSVYVGTLNQYACKFLRRAGAVALNASPFFTIWDQWQASRAIKELAEDLPGVGRLLPGDIKEFLRWHGLNQTLDAVATQFDPKEGFWLDLRQRYTEEKRRQHVLDEHDLIPMAVRALDQKPRLQEEWRQNDSRHLLVDMFHDATSAQYDLLYRMTGPTRSIAIATDPNQSVRVTQGAGTDMLSRFRSDHKDVQIHRLEHNHRSTETLSRAAKSLIDHLGLYENAPTPVRRGGPEPTLLVVLGPPQLMFDHVLQRASELTHAGYTWDDMACIFPKDDSVGDMLASLFSRNVPFEMLGAAGLEDTGRVRDSDAHRVISLLSCFLNPWDADAFAAAASTDVRSNSPRLAPRVLREIKAHARDEEVSLIEAAIYHVQQANPSAGVHRDLTYLNEAWFQLDRTLSNPEVGLSDLCWMAQEQLIDARMGVGRGAPDPRMRRLRELGDNTPRLPGENAEQHLARFLDRLSPVLHPYRRPLDNPHPAATRRGLTVTTIDASSGLEWPVVFVMDAADHIIPGSLQADDVHLREQARLFYTASTRASDRLYYCYSRQSGRGFDAERSQCLASLDDQLVVEVIDPGY